MAFTHSLAKGCSQGGVCEFLLIVVADKVGSGSLRAAFNRKMQVLEPGSERPQEPTRKW